jgi:ADP-ribose pyrophosphatase YjhB (NUDIX family)
MSEHPQYPELIVGALLVNRQGQIFVARLSKVTGHYAVPGGHVHLHPRPLSFHLADGFVNRLTVK